MKRIRQERQRRGWRLDDYAYHSGLGSADISRIETGRLRPSPGQLARLARPLDLDPNTLMDDVPDAESSLKHDDFLAEGEAAEGGRSHGTRTPGRRRHSGRTRRSGRE